MKFGPVSPADAIGGVTVHAIRQNGFVLKKGTTIGAAEAEQLQKAGIAQIVVARLDDNVKAMLTLDVDPQSLM